LKTRILTAGRLVVCCLVFTMIGRYGITGINHEWSVRTRHIQSEGQGYIHFPFVHPAYNSSHFTICHVISSQRAVIPSARVLKIFNPRTGVSVDCAADLQMSLPPFASRATFKARREPALQAFMATLSVKRLTVVRGTNRYPRNQTYHH